MTRFWATRHGGGLLILATLCLGLVAIIYRELYPPADLSPAVPMPAAARPANANAQSPAAPTLPPLGSYAEVAERPIFSPTRRPPSPDAAQEALGQASSFALVGIVISESSRTALIAHGQPAVVARLAEGQSVEGWSIQSILPDRVVLLHGGSRQELKLKDRPSAGGPPRNAR